MLNSCSTGRRGREHRQRLRGRLPGRADPAVGASTNLDKTVDSSHLVGGSGRPVSRPPRTPPHCSLLLCKWLRVLRLLGALNAHTFRNLEFEKIRALLLQQAGSARGREPVSRPCGPPTDVRQVRQALGRHHRGRALLLAALGRQPYHDLPDVAELLPQARVAGFHLEPAGPPGRGVVHRGRGRDRLPRGAGGGRAHPGSRPGRPGARHHRGGRGHPPRHPAERRGGRRRLAPAGRAAPHPHPPAQPAHLGDGVATCATRTPTGSCRTSSSPPATTASCCW